MRVGCGVGGCHCLCGNVPDRCDSVWRCKGVKQCTSRKTTTLAAWYPAGCPHQQNESYTTATPLLPQKTHIACTRRLPVPAHGGSRVGAAGQGRAASVVARFNDRSCVPVDALRSRALPRSPQLSRLQKESAPKGMQRPPNDQQAAMRKVDMRSWPGLVTGSGYHKGSKLPSVTSVLSPSPDFRCPSPPASVKHPTPLPASAIPPPCDTIQRQRSRSHSDDSHTQSASSDSEAWSELDDERWTTEPERRPDQPSRGGGGTYCTRDSPRRRGDGSRRSATPERITSLTPLSDSNVGMRMLKMMGWSGGGLGPKGAGESTGRGSADGGRPFSHLSLSTAKRPSLKNTRHIRNRTSRANSSARADEWSRPGQGKHRDTHA